MFGFESGYLLLLLILSLFPWYLSAFKLFSISSLSDVTTNEEKNNTIGKLFTSTKMFELLSNRSYEFNLKLKLLETTKDRLIQTRFYCEDSDSEKFDWNSTKSNCKILNLKPSFDYTFNDEDQNQTVKVTLLTLKPGKQILVAHARIQNENLRRGQIDTSKAYIDVNVGRSNLILLISTIIGWTYFVAWSISFYPQLWDNFKRKSVIGLNFDFVALNLTGFISYSIFNIALFAFEVVQKEYEIRHPRSQIPVQINDVVFAVHAALATFACIIQCLIYERGNQKISILGTLFLAVVWIGYIILAFLVYFTSYLSVLDYLYICSYVKLVITIIKYIPQAWFNYRRKSTVGWSIGNIFLDSTGGLLSMCQMFLLSYNYDDWISIFNNFTKFGLGFISILFDLLFVLQHFVFYRNSSAQRYDSRTILVDNNIQNQSVRPSEEQRATSNQDTNEKLQ
ncbi:Cystinosin -like protein [Sarcoptes scabiei]|uniref:Cystinosin homolog n=2 Tax=Sarcoptes scabiei TaxID=52283 RepID=A0A834RGZ2_SARSC|nr:Cystinosin -like protein [Sarcoptes scabiei]